MTKVLIIEDDPIIANIYRSRLDKEGFQVEIASDGQSGFYRIHETHPDAILLDLMLPKMDGLQILKKLRAQKQFQDIPVIVFTNAYVPDMIEEAMKAGANFVFNKSSLTPKQLVEAFQKALFPAAGASMSAVRPEAPPAPPAEPSLRFITAIPQPPVAPRPPAAESAPHSPPAPKAASEASQPTVDAARKSLWPPAQTYFEKATPTPEPAPTPPVPEIKSTPDTVFQDELRSTYKSTIPETLSGMRKLLHDFLKNSDESQRLAHLFELYRKIHAVTGNSAIVGLYNVAHTCAALEALIKELKEKPKNINPSTLRTITHSVDFLGLLLEKDPGANILQTAPANILVVDDEIISRRAVVYALEKAQLKSENLDDPMAAFQLLSQKTFDLVILDVDMPVMNGFELCAKLRTLPANQNTPVIFVTGLNDFDSRARSSLSGGNDLIAKPFLFIELTVKALVFVLKHRLTQRPLFTGNTPPNEKDQGRPPDKG
jgi:CheY-like chemotaxis protein